jgi:hypothetical protein
MAMSWPLELITALQGRRQPVPGMAQAAGDYGVPAAAGVAPSMASLLVKSEQGAGPRVADNTNGGLGGGNDHSTRNDILMLLLGGGKAMMEQKAQRQYLQQAVGNQRDTNARSRQAYHGAFGPDGQFDPNRYMKSIDEAHAPIPDSEDLGRFGVMAETKAERVSKNAASMRQLAASVVTPLLKHPESERAALEAAMALGIGADAYADNEREAQQTAETGRHNLRSEDLTASGQSETARHNRVGEGYEGARVGIANRAETRAAGGGSGEGIGGVSNADLLAVLRGR